MGKVLRFNSIDYPLLVNPKIKIKSNDISISDATIDFTGGVIADLPFKFQEVKIVDNPGVSETVELVGYVEKHILPKFETGKETLKLTLKLMPPRILASKRTITKIIKGETLNDAVEEIVQLLINDGFTIAENDLTTNETITKQFINTTIEKTLNTLAKDYNFVWYVDELKNIYFKDAVNIFNQPPLIEWNGGGTPFVSSLKPQIRSNDYANIINIKNSRTLIEGTSYFGLHFGDEKVTLTNPIWLSDTAFRKRNATATSFGNIIVIFDGLGNSYAVDYLNGNFIFPNEISLQGSSTVNTLFELGYDSNDESLITSVKLRLPALPGNARYSITVHSYLTIKPLVYRFFDVNEIEKTALLANTTGIIEKTIDINNIRISENELFQIAKGNILQANNEVSIVNVELEDLTSNTSFMAFVSNLKLFSRILIDLPNILINGDFVVTSIETIEQINKIKIKLVLENKNFNETYLDIYRKTEIQEDERQVDTNLISILVKDEDFVESNEILVNGVNVNVIT